MYSTIRKSKALRAYQNASRLKELGVATPEEVAVIESFKKGMLQHCYFVSAFTPDRSLAFLNDFEIGDKDIFPLLDALALWLVEIHDKGVCHRDLNLGNVLFHVNSFGGFSFQLIDNNRMTFYKNMSLDMRIKNLRRITHNVDLLNYILKRYAAWSNLDSNEIQLRGCFYLAMFRAKQKAKKTLKHWIF